MSSWRVKIVSRIIEDVVVTCQMHVITREKVRRILVSSPENIVSGNMHDIKVSSVFAYLGSLCLYVCVYVYICICVCVHVYVRISVGKQVKQTHSFDICYSSNLYYCMTLKHASFNYIWSTSITVQLPRL